MPGSADVRGVRGKGLFAVVGLVGVAVIAAGTALLQAATVPPPTPARPQPPPPPETLMNTQLKYSPTLYRGLLEDDARKFGVSAPTPQEMARPLAYTDELGNGSNKRIKLRVGDPLDTPHLRISLAVGKQTAKVEGQSYATEHLVLRISNRSDHYLAYRIDTTLPDVKRCLSKGEIPHDALVLPPKQTIERTECLYHGGKAVDVLRAEVMELTALGAHYVSRLPATSMMYDARTAGSHVPLKGGLCPQTFSWRELREGVERKHFGWKDIIDFYARHNCEEYAFFKAYRYRNDATLPLPARPPE